jgi:hypothetical protein
MTDVESTLTYRGLRLDMARARLYLDGAMLQLRPTEARLLGALLKAPKWVITYDQLTAKLPDGDADADPKRTIHAHFSRLGALLRSPLEQATGISCRPGSGAFLWENVRGTGYAINDRWLGWAGLEVLERHSTTSPVTAIAPAAGNQEPATERSVSNDGEAAMCSEPAPTALATETVAASQAAVPPAAQRHAFWRLRWHGRHVSFPSLLVLPVTILAGLRSVRVDRPMNWSIAEDDYGVAMSAGATEASPGTFVRITGTTSNVPNAAPLWLVIASGDSYWPQQRVTRNQGDWFGYARVGDSVADSGLVLDVLAVLVDHQIDQEFDAWLSRGNRIRQYPPFPALPTGTRVTARTTVRVTASEP